MESILEGAEFIYHLTFLVAIHKVQAKDINAPREISRMQVINTICEVIVVAFLFWGIREAIREKVLIAIKKTTKIRNFITKLAKNPWFVPLLVIGMATYSLRTDLHRVGIVTRWDIYLISKDMAYISMGMIGFFVLSIVDGMHSMLGLQREMLGMQKEMAQIIENPESE